jgi:hypothetical protein
MLAIATLMASGLIVACPATIRDEQQVSKIHGWEVQVSAFERRLDYAEIFVGHPSRFVQLMPVKEGGAYVWRPESAKDIWMRCRYHNSAAVLTRHVGRVETCSSSSEITKHGQVTKAECKKK